ncbi:MAG: maltose ABC transporter substrate-binding protein [Candidatus Promineifilaceae bacterium]|nr:maltose ABC transporter substrate-binding protein [Candidatus Promineifilaceae bacterium]
MSKKLSIFLSLLLIGALVLVACGGEEAAEEPTAEPAEEVVEEPAEEPTEEPMEEPTEEPMEEPAEEPMEEPTEEPMEEPAEEATVQLVVWGDEVVAPAVEALAPQFLEEFGIDLVVQQIAFDDQREQIRIAAPAGEGPDIFVTAHDRIGEFIASGLISPISVGDKADSFVPSSLEAFTFEGELYGLPYATENVGFFRNVDLVAEPVETWEDVQTIAASLVEEGSASAATALSSSNFHAYGINTAFGGYIFGTDDQGFIDPTDVGLDSEGFIASGEYLQGLVDAGLMPSTVDGETAQSLFETGEIPFIIEGPWVLNRFRESDINYTIDPLPAGPAGPGAPFLGVRGFVVNAFSENQLLAETFLTELVATDDVMMQLFEADPRPPAWIPTAEAIEDEDISNFGAIAPVAQPMPAIPEMGSVWGAWGDAIQLILNQEQEPAPALENAAQQVRDLIAE